MRYSSTILNLGTRLRDEKSASHPDHFTPRYPLDRRLGGPQNKSERCGKQINLFLFTGIDSSVVQPVNLTAIPTELPQLSVHDVSQINIIPTLSFYILHFNIIVTFMHISPKFKFSDCNFCTLHSLRATSPAHLYLLDSVTIATNEEEQRL
jgi:hypothetical protein